MGDRGARLLLKTLRVLTPSVKPGVWRWLSPGLFVVGWLVVATFQFVEYLPSPVAVAAVLVRDWHLLVTDAVATSLRALGGFAIGAGLGVVVALGMALSGAVRAFLDPIVRVVRPAPLLALIPLFILWFGLSEKGRILFIAVGCFFLTVIVALEAIQNVPQIYLRSGRSLGTEGMLLYILVVLPAILPGIYGGLRVALTTSFQLAIAAELLGAQTGLGFYLTEGAVTFQMTSMVAAVVVVSVLAFGADLASKYLGRVAMPWLDT